METASKRISTFHFLKMAYDVPVLDVRSPSEFEQGHIPGAVNLPLFDDEERAIVGTAYTRSGFDKAFYAGLDFTGKKLSYFVMEARKLSANNKVLIYCWRGGMRSESMAWLFNFSGIETWVLDGGYKAYRRYIRESFSKGPALKVIGGMTGSGKTELLRCLADAGEQVVDLEALARHKGSAFGGLGEEEQPTNEQFENNLAACWLSYKDSRPVWVEDESNNIGKVVIPEPFFRQMSAAPVFIINVSHEERLERITRDYGSYDKELLEGLVTKVSKRMGGENAKRAIEHIRHDKMVEAIKIVLDYYDKAYQYSLSKKNMNNLKRINKGSEDIKSLTGKLIESDVN